MAQIWPDRTLETASAVGTGPLALLGAVDGYRRFNETAEIGDTVFGARFGVDATGNPTGPYETGEFTYSADDVLALTTISASSNGGNPVDWSGTQWIMACPIGENFADWEAGVGAALTAADIGVSVQAYSTNLAEYAAVNPTAAGLALLDDADAPAQRTTLGLGTLATQSGTFSGTSSGTNTGDQTITLTGDVTGSGTGSFAATIANGAVSLTKQANMATASLVYRKTAGSGAPEVNTLATLKTDLGLTGTNSGDQTSVSGNAGTATALATPRTISITGKATAAGGTFDGTGNLALNVTAMTLVAGDLPSTAVTPGSYTLASITVDAQGRLTAASSGSGGTATLADGDYGDITASSSGTVLTIDAGVVTLAKIANATANSKLVGSGAAGSGAAYSEITLGSGLTMTGTTLSSSGGLSANSTTDILAGTDTSKAATADSIAALWEQGSDVASSGTISLGEGGYFFITGTTTITDIDFATDKAGREAWVKFSGILTLTHNASTLILPGGANITTAAGDTACFISEGSDVVRCVAYQRASGLPVVSPSSGALTLITETVTSGSASNVSFTSIAATYRDLRLVVRGRGTTASNEINLLIRMNADTGSNYTWAGGYAASTPAGGNVGSAGNTTSMQIGYLTAASSTSGTCGMCEALVGDYRGTTFHKSVSAGGSHYNASATEYSEHFGGIWKSTSAITQIDVFLSAGNFVDNTVISLYGVM